MKFNDSLIDKLQERIDLNNRRSNPYDATGLMENRGLKYAIDIIRQHQQAPSQEVVQTIANAMIRRHKEMFGDDAILQAPGSLANAAIAAMSKPCVESSTSFMTHADEALEAIEHAKERRSEISVVEAIREAIRSPRFGRFSTGEPQQVDLILKAIGPYLKACELCNCTGDVHRADGEWMGACPYCAPKPVMVDDKALYHLGGVLTMLAELHPDDQCRAYVEALEYHNANSTDGVIVPSEGYSSRIVTTGPLDLIMQASEQPVQETIEALAALEHDQWLHWMRTVILEEAISIKRKERWWSCDKPYHELTEEQKEHDRVWARKVLEIVRPSVRESGYREIICTDGTPIKVDAEDYPMLSRHNWYLNYSAVRPYAITKMKTDQSKIWRCIFMHHLIMGTTTTVDHIDNDPLNNCKANLRKATRQQNNINKPKAPNKLGKPTSSKYKGVHKYSSNGKFRATIGHNRKVIQLGTFENEDDAARAYNAKALELFGKYAWLNSVPDKVNRIEGELKP